MFQLTYCQQAGNKHQKNQDALFNGKAVYQWQLKNAESDILDDKKVILGVADGISNCPKPQLASRFLMEKIATCKALNAAWLRNVQAELCERFALSDFGTSSTFVGCELHFDEKSAVGNGNVLNVGDSRAYKISATDEWSQLSFDHSVLAEMKAQGLALAEIEYAAMYHALSDCITADFDAADFRIHSAAFQLEKGESILLCSDGLHDYITPQQLAHIWQRYTNNTERLQICRKMVKKHRLYDDFSVVVCEIV
ncbi:PP2C family protein-serine/threonine phosphatase [Pasteurella bettyae]|uniref:Stage II sporulation protein E domain protein n=1 Tax=Pasteurella bettyae CCUG 2042 TaxID=1095749 RepID=I3DFJ3_9PAST|nr:protein phosphatase 2C domain-containing protein [Pasteurella bettyae]EIJ70486.1 stage II sporulation protein E domain protein [Pasteurella bettyae CCUG 2042]SUB21089.1 Protein phosphatase 2C [Pasteurella bettyae]